MAGADFLPKKKGELLENQALIPYFLCCFVHGVLRFPWSLAFTWALRGLFSWKYRNQIGGVADFALESLQGMLLWSTQVMYLHVLLMSKSSTAWNNANSTKTHPSTNFTNCTNLSNSAKSRPENPKSYRRVGRQHGKELLARQQWVQIKPANWIQLAYFNMRNMFHLSNVS